MYTMIILWVKWQVKGVRLVEMNATANNDKFIFKHTHAVKKPQHSSDSSIENNSVYRHKKINAEMVVYLVAVL